MKDVNLVGILAAASLLAASPSTHAPQSTTLHSTSSQSAINKVRNGYLKYNRTTTVGQALAGTFQNGEWKTFTTAKGTTIVEFDGSEPFSNFRGNNPPDAQDCAGNLICDALDKKITANCSSAAGQAPYLRNYEDTKADLNARIAALEKQAQAENSVLKPMDDHKAVGEQMKLQNELISLANPEMSCYVKTWANYATTAIPISVQFSINHDGTFQYLASDTFSPDELFSKMYN